MAEKQLEALLKRLAQPSTPSLSLEETILLADSLAPTSSRHQKSLSYLALSKLCQDLQASPETADDLVLDTFKPYIQSILVAEGEDIDPSSFIALASFLTALFPLCPGGATKILIFPTLTSGHDQSDNAADILDLLLELAELPSPLQPVLAELLGSAAGTKAGREIILTRAVEWLRGAVDYGTIDEGQELGALCAVALSKLGQGEVNSVPNASEEQVPPEQREAENQALARKMMNHILSTPNSRTPNSATISTLEGLSVLSLRPHIKALLASSPPFLHALLALSPTLAPKSGSLPVTPRASMDLAPESARLFDTVENSLLYGLTTILVNITSPKPTLSAEDQQIAKLRAMAISANKGALKDGNEGQDDPFETEAEVRKRVQAVLRAGGVKALHGLSRAESRLVKEGLGRLCRNLVEDQSDRLGFVRDGGFKVLSGVVRDLSNTSITTPKKPIPTSSTPNQTGTDVLPALQALAKLVITTSPTLLFPPPHLTTSLNALTPLYHLLIHPSSTSLQHFEALMALTNLASIDPSIGSRIVEASIKPLAQSDMWRGKGSTGDELSTRIIIRVEELMLDENDLVRRAATELICNLISSPKGYEHFSGESTSTPCAQNGRVKSKLNILLVLTGTDDLQTRLAAGGALAIVTESPIACRALLSNSKDDGINSTNFKSKRSLWTRVLDLLTPDEEEILDEDGTPIPIISTAGASAAASEGERVNPDLVLRGVIILLNLMTFTLALQGTARVDGLKGIEEAGVQNNLMNILKMREGLGDEVLGATVECLKMLKKA